MIDRWYYDKAVWGYSFALIPRRCDISKRWIWGRHCRGQAIISGPGDPCIIDIWNHRDEHLLYKLKGEI